MKSNTGVKFTSPQKLFGFNPSGTTLLEPGVDREIMRSWLAELSGESRVA